MVVIELVSSKKELELILEGIPKYRRAKRELEQYETPSHIAAHVLWRARLNGDIEGKVVADFGCGTAKLAIGSLLLGARWAICIDVDVDVIKQSSTAIASLFPEVASRVLFVAGRVEDVQLVDIDTVLMNPPFGTVRRNRGIDMAFLRKALLAASSVYTIHKHSERLDEVVSNLAKSCGYSVVYSETINFPIPMMFVTHRRRVYRFRAVFYVLRRGEQ